MHAAEIRQLLTQAVQAHERGELDLAADGYRKVLQVEPKQADALHLLGIVADQQGRHDEAVALISQAIALSPRAATFHGNLGTALLALGQTERAEAAYREALRLDSGYVDGQLNLANLLTKRGEQEEALLHYRAAVAADPRRIEAQLGLATALFNNNRASEALPHITTAVHLDPAFAPARNLAALVLYRCEDFGKAVFQSRKAVALAPDEIAYRETLARALLKSKKPEFYEEAVELFRTVLDREPDRLDSLIGIGSALVKNQQPLAAMPYFERAIAIDGNRVELLANYVVPLIYAGRFDEALRCCERAIQLAPDDCLVLSQRGTAREYIGDYGGALAEYSAAQEATSRRDPDTLAEVEFKKSLLLLAQGKLSEGWPLYHRRLDARSAQPWLKEFETILPRWDGIVRPGQRIMVWGEQGVGDQILYASMLPDLLVRGADVAFLCDPRLIPLFARSLPTLRLFPLKPKTAEQLRSEADVQISLGELGLVLRPNLESFPSPAAYLKPDRAQVAAFRQQYLARNKQLVVGLTWRSRSPTGAYKTVPLLEWAPVLRQENILFVDLQYGDTAEDRRLVRENLGVEILHDGRVDPLKNLDGFAAQAAAVDLVIGGSNSGQHIAAAVGTSCWIAVPGGTGRLWYWFLNRDDSPWYPKVRLFRQQPGRYDDWNAPIAAMAAALETELGASA